VRFCAPFTGVKQKQKLEAGVEADTGVETEAGGQK
jgi:hypothetical protein